MLKYISRRLLQAIPTLLISSIFVFLIIRAIPGDPARTIVGLDAPIEEVEAVRVELGLDQPIPIQYIRWIRRALRGDLGKSAVNRFPVNEIIAMKFPATVELAVAAMLAALAVSVPLGIIAALKAGTRFDYFVSVLSALYQGAPNFWVGIMYILIFSVNLKLLPPSGRVPLLEAPARALQSLIMPVITLCMPMAMGQMRFVRASLLEVLNQDYVRTAYAKGLRERIVVIRHALRNALVPVVTVLGIQFGHLLGGAVIVESLFGWPGLGRSLVESITNRDYAITQGGLLYMVTVFVLVNLAVDVLYGIIDPRSRPRQER
jgi:peptide/nickel transport system permease protein